MASPEDDQIKQVVLDFLRTADIATTTERKVLAHVQEALVLTRPVSEYKPLVSGVIDEFLASLDDEGAEGDDGHDEGHSGGDDDGEEPAPKGPGRKRAGSGAAAAAAGAKKSRKGGSGGEELLFSRDLSARRKARVRRWEGKLYIDVREFFNGPEGEAPTQKGLSMDPGQWARLARELPRLVEAQRSAEADAPPAQLAEKRMAAVSEFKGTCYLGLREYYEKDGKLLPGKKGVSLNLAESTLLLAAVPEITAAAGGLVDAPPLEHGATQPDKAVASGSGSSAASGRPSAAAGKAAAGTAAASGSQVGGSAEAREFVDIGGSKRVSISRFGGRLSVDLREYYEKNGAMLPGKKGIALSPDDWRTLAGALGDVSAALARKDSTYSMQLSGKRKVSLSDFKGTTYVGVREYYDKGNGEMAPGQKGLNMNPQQWAALVAGAPSISAALQQAQEGH
ncbi:hypothetical protein GPECTOR_1g38 [Gonium pectorale]|uniref:DEK-C domain-containing protein n=1 Tax=Gonium pectorale TaxID=33097 RepID=A0A150H2M5_GONPE|nr:hypothetical protein GPECTOR_1g38 [Gonium pectorale]|eukprot:KXZ56426.1 hypothetical protein GPECTOR_1g38 [Gonium pectorale]